MDAMSGRGELEDWGLVAEFYGLGERVKYKSERTGADGADWQTGGCSGVWNPGRSGLGRTGGLADRVDYGILDGRTGGWGGLRNPGQSGLGQMGRTRANGAD